MICSQTELGSELEKIKQLLIENGYPEDVILACFKEKLANFTSEKPFGPEKCPVYLKLPCGSEMFHLNLKNKSVKPSHVVSTL